jgi:hypothetical protein
MILIRKRSRGPARCFGDVEAYMLLSFLNEEGKTSRRRAAEYIDIGEGSVRKIADIMMRAGLVEIFQTGMFISDYGKELITLLPLRMINMEPVDCVVGSSQQAVLVKDVSEKITNGMAQRDAGIRAGSSGCTTFVFRNGKIIMPPGWDVEKASPSLSEIIAKTGITENDALIIGGDAHPPLARKAALTAAMELI